MFMVSPIELLLARLGIDCMYSVLCAFLPFGCLLYYIYIYIYICESRERKHGVVSVQAGNGGFFYLFFLSIHTGRCEGSDACNRAPFIQNKVKI